MSTSDPTPRRRFLQTTAVAAAAIACSGCAAFQRRDVSARAAKGAETLVIDLAEHPELGAENGFIRAIAGDDRLIIVHMPGGSFTALSMVCTHWGCDVDWAAAQKGFHCSCHGSRFAPDGQVLEGPADEPLAVYPVSVDGQILTVALKG
jgi:Rieske Fe-S protein